MKENVVNFNVVTEVFVEVVKALSETVLALQVAVARKDNVEEHTLKQQIAT
jgi:hypothetical protein